MNKKFLCLLILPFLCSCTTSTDKKSVLPNTAVTANENYSYADSLSNKKMCWGQGYNCNEKNQPISCVEYNAKYGKYSAKFLSENSKSIALTFDEGYENGYTAQILDVLKDKKVKAVFFVTYDYVSRNPELVQRMIDEGHVVGNHTWSHPSMPEKSTADAVEEITKLHDYIEENFNYSMTLFRAPRGEFSERTLELTKAVGYTSVFWSFAYYDYNVNDQPDNATALKRITSAAHEGAIYLLHAVSKTNTEILPDVIDTLRECGYTFSTSQL